jgi:hypothetical protein
MVGLRYLRLSVAEAGMRGQCEMEFVADDLPETGVLRGVWLW